MITELQAPDPSIRTAPGPGLRAEDRPERVPPATDGPPALLVDHVSKRFVVVAVDDVSRRIGRGEVYGVLGANGGAKSTPVRRVSTLLARRVAIARPLKGVG